MVNLRGAFRVCRRIPRIAGWIRNGCSGPPPPVVKRLIISSYLRKYNLLDFIETGTFRGDTLSWVANDPKIACQSIEVNDELYQSAVKRFRNEPNISLFKGDSGVLLPKLIQKLERPALFWLDGHYSGTGTGRSEIDTPISSELKSIFNHPIRSHVILIDDAHDFIGQAGYPTLERLLESIRHQSGYQCEISANIIRITPTATFRKV